MSGSIGDNVFRASGVIAAAAAGREGTVDWVTTPKVTGDSPVTAATGSGYFLNTTAGTITINLPAGAAGSIVSMADYAATWQTNNVTVAANGSEKIGGVAEDATLDTEGQSVTFVYVDSTQGWINTMDSTSNVRGALPFLTATGGTPCAGETSGDYRYHTFTGPGTFCVSVLAPGPSGNPNNVDYLVVAGGAGGGSSYAAGGGAGGYRESVPSPAAWTGSPIANPGNARPVTVQGYSIVVGAGGAGGGPGANIAGTSGNASSFSDIPSAGGGGGAAEGASSATGGSGGGGSYSDGASAGNTPPTSPAQGFAGGSGGGSPGYGGGGGGGATAVGANGAPTQGGVGGAGGTSCISATPTARGGGGGGGGGGTNYCFGAGGAGGGGAGAPAPTGIGVAGTCNTGGGGGGGSNAAPRLGGTGGSGIVILRYKVQ